MEGLVSDFFRALRNLVFTVSGVNPMRAEVVIFQCVKLGTNGKRKLQYLATEAVKMRWENRRLEQDGKEKSCRNNARPYLTSRIQEHLVRKKTQADRHIYTISFIF
jgi:hypothetical protein